MQSQPGSVLGWGRGGPHCPTVNTGREGGQPAYTSAVLMRYRNRLSYNFKSKKKKQIKSKGWDSYTLVYSEIILHNGVLPDDCRWPSFYHSRVLLWSTSKARDQQAEGVLAPAPSHISPVTCSSNRYQFHRRENWGWEQFYSTCYLLAFHTGRPKDWETESMWKLQSMTPCPQRLTMNFTRSVVLTEASWWLPNVYCCYFCNPVSTDEK